MNKAEREARAAAIQVIARNYPNLSFADASKLQDRLYMIAVKAKRNAEDLCNIPNHPDQRQNILKGVEKLLAKYDVPGLTVEVGGDPRGFCLKLHLPDGSYNSMGGREAGWGL